MPSIAAIISDLGISNYSVTEKSKGCDHFVYLVRSPKRHVVIKIPRREGNKLIAESYAFRKWYALGLPVPKIIQVTKEYVVEELIEGDNMSDAVLSLAQKQQIMKKVGRVMKSMHSVRTKKYGELVKPGIGAHSSLRRVIGDELGAHVPPIKSKQLLAINDIARLERVIKNFDDVLDYADPRLLHCDCEGSNIMVKKGRLAGIIDAGDAYSGDPCYDVGLNVARIFDKELVDPFLKGYGRTDMKRVNFYALICCLWRVAALTRKEKVKKAGKFKERAIYFLDQLDHSSW